MLALYIRVTYAVAFYFENKPICEVRRQAGCGLKAKCGFNVVPMFTYKYINVR